VTPTIITIPGERPMSWNVFYSGKHWRNRMAEADRVHAMVRAHLPHFNAYTVPVVITVAAYFDKEPLDPDNIPAKLYIDGLCGWLLTDDTRKQISEVRTQSWIDHTNPRVVIVIQETI